MSTLLLQVALSSLDSGGATVVHRYATADYITSSASTPPGTHIDGRLVQPGLMRRTMYGDKRTQGQIEIAEGAIVLANADGGLDGLRAYAFDGSFFSIIEINSAGAQVRTVAQGFIEQPEFSPDAVVFQVRDAAHALDVALLTSKYAGTNSLPAGVEGTANDIKGLPKPLLVGTVFNATPICVNTSKLIYQLDGVRGFASGYSLTVYDKRSTLTAGATYSNQADMEATAPAAGQYRVWVAGGMFRLGSALVGQITCDCTNPADVSGSGTAEVNWVLRKLITLVPSVSTGGVAQYYTATPDVGIYATEERTLLSALQEVAASVSAFLTFGDEPTAVYGGVYWLSHLTTAAAPPYTPALQSLELNESNMVRGTLRRVAAADPSRGLPVWRVNLRYAKNYTVMDGTALAGVAAADQAFCAQEYRTVSVSDSAVKTQWPAAPELNVTTLLTDATQATTEANRLLTLFKTQRAMYTVRIPMSVVRDDAQMGTAGREWPLFQIGAWVLASASRYGLSSTVLQVVGLLQNFEKDEFELTLWG